MYFLHRSEFGPKWRGWTKECILNSSFFVLIYNALSGLRALEV